MRRATLLTLSLLAAIGLPAHAADPPPCPAGASWQGQPPPSGTGYSCVRTGPDGQPQRHGWAVLYHPVSQQKLEECEYSEGVRHGRCTLYDERGALQERGTFDRGVRTGAWWYWSLPTATGRLRSLTLAVGEPDAAVARRAAVEAFVAEHGADAAESVALAEGLLSYVDRAGADRRQICGPRVCVGPGRIPDEPIYVASVSAPEQVERDRKLLTALDTSARKRARAEAGAVKAEQLRREREQAREQARERAQAREWAREQAREQSYEVDDEPAQQCCKYCSTGKPCGDSCIARNKTCRKGPGCAC